MKEYRGYLIDLDGTLFCGNRGVEGADRFIAWLQQEKADYLYFTNNSSRTPAQLASFLQQIGLPAQPSDFFTSSQAAAAYVGEKMPDAKVFLLGEEGLRHAFRAKGIFLLDEVQWGDTVDFLVTGIDRNVTYHRLTQACWALQSGARWLATNLDRRLPLDKGWAPGNGAICAALASAAGREPVVVGKPEPYMIEQALRQMGLAPSDVLMIGDNLETDMLGAIRLGMDTALVLTGVTSEEQVPEDFGVTYCFASVAEIPDFFSASSSHR